VLKTKDGRTVVPNDVELRRDILNEAHHTIHPENTKMYQDLKKKFWWCGMKRNVAEYVHNVLLANLLKQNINGQQGHFSHLMSQCGNGTKSLWISWLGYLGHLVDKIWVVVDRLTKSAHFLPIKIIDSLEKLAELYVREGRLHGVPVSIVLDRDSRFTSKFWECLQGAMGTKLHFSTAYHPQSNGQYERTVQTLEDMLRLCVLDFKCNWIKYIPLVEFAYNNSFQATIVTEIKAPLRRISFKYQLGRL
jgi:hypothetical protein